MIVIVGNGMAGHRLAQGLRRRDPGLGVTVLGAEPRPAYNRVLLSAVLAGTTPAEAVELPDPGVDVRLGTRVVAIDTGRRSITLADDTAVPYDELILATGSRAVIPPVAGLARASGKPADGVATFRTVDDCDRIAELARDGPVAVLGGGLLGVEAARGLAGRGVEVTLVHLAGHLMERQLDAGAGAVLASVLEGIGVRVRLGVGAVAWTPGHLTLGDGDVLDVAGVVVTAGVAPRTRLARAAGVAVARGVLVNDQLATSASGVHAIGECAEHRGLVHGLVGPCWEQADVLADVLTGTASRYQGSPMITRLKALGVDLAAMGSLDTEGAEVVSVADVARGRYGALTVRDGRIAGAVLLGLPEATGPVIQLHDTGALAPADRFALLLGRAAPGGATDSPAQLPARAAVCRCNGVTKGDLVAAWRGGARDVVALAGVTRATTGCGSCAPAVEGICTWLANTEPTEGAA